MTKAIRAGGVERSCVGSDDAGDLAGRALSSRRQTKSAGQSLPAMLKAFHLGARSLAVSNQLGCQGKQVIALVLRGLSMTDLADLCGLRNSQVVHRFGPVNQARTTTRRQRRSASC